MILDEIISHKQVEVEDRKSKMSLSDAIALAASAEPARDFLAALRRSAPVPAVIAEVKKASPSKGVIREDFDPVAIALDYEQAGASAISVLTDEEFFQGSLDYLTSVRRSVSIPVLRKDFIVDGYQVYETRAAGADALLLIAAVLSERELKLLLDLSHKLGMQCLVETHSQQEIQTAVKVGAKLIGINNRDLQTFKVDISTTLRLLPFVPIDATVVSESGIMSREDVRYLRERNVDAVLIGETLMRAPDPGAALKEFLT